MTVTELHPLSLGELLDRTFSYYRRYFWLFIGIMAVPEVLRVGLVLSFQAVSHPTPPPVTSGNPADVLKGLAPALAVSMALLMVILIGSFFIYSVALGATTYALSEVHLGRPATVKSAYRNIQGQVGRLLGLTFLILLIAFGAYVVLIGAAIIIVGVLVLLMRAVTASMGVVFLALMIGVIALVSIAGIVLGLIFLLRYALAVPALVLENADIGQALKRSAFLTRGYKVQIFVIALLMYLVTAAVGLVFQGPFLAAGIVLGFKFGIMPLWLRIPYAVSAGIGGALSGPFLMIALALAYYDTRVRKEGFDLQLMMAALDQTSAPSAVAPAIPPALS